MDDPKESWCSAAFPSHEDGPISGQLPVETLIAMRNETTETLRQAGFFSLPHPETVSPASANLLTKRQFLSDAILSQVRSLNIKKSHPVVKALSSLDKLESQFEEVKKQQRELPHETSAADRKQIQDQMSTRCHPHVIST